MTISPAIDFVTAAFGSVTEAPVFTLVSVAATTIAGTGRSLLGCRWRAMLMATTTSIAVMFMNADGGGDRHGHARIDVELLLVLDLGVGNDRHHDPRVSYHDGTRS
jgi:hypothetical protein